MKKNLLILCVSLFILTNSHAQIGFPGIQADTVKGAFGDVVNVIFTSLNSNFNNVTNFNGSITFDPKVLEYKGFVSANPAMLGFGTIFDSTSFDLTNIASGELGWVFSYKVSIGPTIPIGQEIFTLKFKAIGNPGDTSTIGFGNSPISLYWIGGLPGMGPGAQITKNGKFTITGKACPRPQSIFTHSTNSKTVNLSNYSISGTNPSYYWDFDDGTFDVTSNPVHIFNSNGNYNVCLAVIDSCASDTSCQKVKICESSTAGFTSNGKGLKWNFTDNSTVLLPISRLWDFGDGNTDTSKNPSHTYLTFGNYIVSLTVTDSCGSSSSMDTIKSCAKPLAQFITNDNGRVWSFFNTTGTSGILTSIWDFGDGNTDTLKDPIHTYAADGRYIVCLTAGNGCRSDTLCNTIDVESTSINELYDNSLISIIPNPSNGIIRIVIDEPGKKEVKIYSVNSQMVQLIAEFSNSLFDVNVEDFNPGVYLVQIEVNNKLIRKRLVVQD